MTEGLKGLTVSYNYLCNITSLSCVSAALTDHF